MINTLDISWLEENVLPAAGGDSLVLFDIDSTIMNTAPRNYRILQEAEQALPYLRGISILIDKEEIGWNFADAVASRLAMTEEQKKELQDFWYERFFFDPWLGYDTPYEGVKEVLHWFREKDIRIVYLTGRDEINMKKGTIDSFADYGLPVDADFILKPSQDHEDLAFKMEAFDRIRSMGSCILAVENEPANANAMKRAFPGTPVALIDTVTAPNPAVPDGDIILFRSYA